MTDTPRLEVLTFVVVVESPRSKYDGAKRFIDRKFLTDWDRLRNACVAVGELNDAGLAPYVARWSPTNMQPSIAMRQQMAAEFEGDSGPEARPA